MKHSCIFLMTVGSIVSGAACLAADAPSYDAAALAPPYGNRAGESPIRDAARLAPSSPPIEYGNLYFGIDAAAHGSLVGYAGILAAPSGMHQSGLRISAFGMHGRYRYFSDPTQVEARFESADLLIGWSELFGNGAITLAVGGNFQNHRLHPSDPDNSVRGAELGFKVQGDIWANPTPSTLVFALASYSTAFNTYYALGRAGYDFAGNQVFIGPEIGTLGNDRTDQVRVGAHVTGLKLGPAKITISGGWLNQRDEGPGGYAAAAVDFTF